MPRFALLPRWATTTPGLIWVLCTTPALLAGWAAAPGLLAVHAWWALLPGILVVEVT